MWDRIGLAQTAQIALVTWLAQIAQFAWKGRGGY